MKITADSVANGITAVLTALCSLLGNPNCDDDALRPLIVREFLEDRYQFDTKARLLTQRFASRDYHNCPIQEDHPVPSVTQNQSDMHQSTALGSTHWLAKLRGRSSN